MFRTALRGAPRATIACRSSTLRTTGRFGAARKRFASTAPAKKRSWKAGAARWAAAGAGVWWYNTSDVFAEAPEAAIERTSESLHRFKESELPTVDAIVEEKREREAQRIAEDEKNRKAAESALASAEDGEPSEVEGEDGMGGLEEEADQQGAFNPETGEINWDCPCLGGMAHGPCGPEFKEAFSCFVYSKEEPKGVECIEKFKGMQDCFRQHPEMYGSELEDDEEEVEEEIRAQQNAKDNDAGALTAENASPKSTSKPTSDASSEPPKAKETAPKSTEPSSPVRESSKKVASKEPTESKPPVEEPHRSSLATSPEKTQNSGDEGGELLPRAVHDATSR